MNMNAWLTEQRDAPTKKAFPILSFPSVQLLGVSVKELIQNADLQAKGMKAVCDACDSLAAVSMMDLSVEAEAFGSQVKFSDDEVPTVVGRLIESEEDADRLTVPPITAGRCGIYIDAIRQATEQITDRPVFAGAIGPFSLSGRLMDMTEIMVNCLIEPDMVHTTLEKATDFIISYIKGFRDAGANGVVIAEPAAGLLSPDLNAEFSVPYMKKIIDALQTDEFLVIYHNCGNVIPLMTDILTMGASAYHFGNAVEMTDILPLIPSDTVVMGNVDPAGQFRNGTPDSIREETLRIMNACCPNYPNFIISSGCDIPPLSSWDNVRAFFEAVQQYYE